MLNKKLLILSLVLCLAQCAYAKLELSDLTQPKTPAYRVGISELPENQYIQTQQQKNDEPQINLAVNEDSTDLSYADLSLKRISREISQDLVYEENDMVADLSLLWQGAAMQSDTINFALYKLANPDENKPQKSTVKNMLKTIASMSTLAGASMANPLLAGTSLIGSNVLGIMSQDTKELNYKYTKVTDADMIILIRKVEDLQQNAVNLYYDYMTAKKQMELAANVALERQKRFESAQKNNASRELVVVTDAYYRSAMDKHKTARSEFLSKRAALEQFVGNEVFTQFESDLKDRERMANMSEEERTAYNQTIQAVEDYTQNVVTGYGASSEPTYYDDPNLSKLPDIAPTTVEEPQQINKTTKKVKKDKYSTKGLIFLHKEKTETEQPVTAKEEKPKKEKKKKKNRSVDLEFKATSPVEAPIETPMNKPTKFNGVDLLPLEELKAPNHYQSGSIFRE